MGSPLGDVLPEKMLAALEARQEASEAGAATNTSGSAQVFSSYLLIEGVRGGRGEFKMTVFICQPCLIEQYMLYFVPLVILSLPKSPFAHHGALPFCLVPFVWCSSFLFAGGSFF